MCLMGVEEFIFPSAHFRPDLSSPDIILGTDIYNRVGLLVRLTSDRLACEVAAYVGGTFCNPCVRSEPRNVGAEGRT